MTALHTAALQTPHRLARLLLWEADEPDHLEDITGFEDVKLRALLAHRSQFRSTMRIDPGQEGNDEVKAFAARLRARYSSTGERLGFTAAEAFKLIEDL